MRSLLFPLSLCLAVSTATVSTAQGGVRDSSHWSGGGTTIAMDVGFTSNPDVVSVQAISASGWSNTTTGTPGDNHSEDWASCDTSGTMIVPTANGPMQVRCKDGKVERNKNGQWIPMRRNFRMDMYGGPAGHTNGPGEEVVTLPFDAGSAISFEEYRQIMGLTSDPTTTRAARRN